MGGQPRENAAAVNAATGDATGWDPNVDGSVFAIAVSGSTVYLGGPLRKVGGQVRIGAAAVDATTGAVKAWNPNVKPSTATALRSAATVWTIAVSGSTVYLGGDFNGIGGATRYNLAAVDAATGDATSWNPTADRYVAAVAVSGSTVYAAGAFGSIGSRRRDYFAALNPTTGRLLPWNPKAVYSFDGYCLGCVGGRALAASGSTVYAGGEFGAIGGRPRDGLAALNSATGAATAWDPDSGWTYGLGVSGSTVFAGGLSGLVAYDPSTAAKKWSRPIGPSCGHYCPSVDLVRVSGPTVYAGGGYTEIGSKSRRYIAALKATTGTVTAWNPNPNARVASLAFAGHRAFAGGGFTKIGGRLRRGLAALTLGSGAATTWNANADGPVSALKAAGPTLYAAGTFKHIGGKARSGLAALSASNGSAMAWNPVVPRGGVPAVPQGGIDSLAVGPDGSLWVGGAFDHVGGKPQAGIARYKP
jgi:hypothetical protein